jgi:TatD DNase family protein
MSALIDSHLHLGREEFDVDRDAVLLRARQAGVAAFLHVGVDRPSIERALLLAGEIEASWASAGIHPHDASSFDDLTEGWLRELGRDGRIVAIGECGLDFFRDLSPRDAQRAAFRRQIALAKELGLPMIFHVRDAYAETRKILETEGLPPRRGVFHAFAGDALFARWAVDAGFKLGIGGPLSYKKSNLPAALSGLPTSGFLLETDAPWLPPQPWRGKRNEPAYLHHTARELAKLCQVDFAELAEQIAASFEELFAVRLPEELRRLDPSACLDPVDSRPPSQGNLLRQHGLKLDKRLGQHFLKDPQICERIATAVAELKPVRVVELGAGAGALSFALLDRGWPVHALELDPRMIELLKKETAGRAFSVERCDLAQTDFAEFARGDALAFAGNLPYQVTSPVLFALLPALRSRGVRGAVLMMQLEVAERIVASPGSKSYGVLSVLLGAECEIELLFRLKPGAFMPPPGVDSAVVRLRPRPERIELGGDGRLLVKDLFQQRRKQLGGLLRRRHGRSADEVESTLGGLGLDPTARPELLTIDDFARLALALRGWDRA